MGGRPMVVSPLETVAFREVVVRWGGIGDNPQNINHHTGINE